MERSITIIIIGHGARYDTITRDMIFANTLRLCLFRRHAVSVSGQPRGIYKEKSVFSARSVVPLFAAVQMRLSDRNRSANGCDWTMVMTSSEIFAKMSPQY